MGILRPELERPRDGRLEEQPRAGDADGGLRVGAVEAQPHSGGVKERLRGGGGGVEIEVELRDRRTEGEFPGGRAQEKPHGDGVEQEVRGRRTEGGRRAGRAAGEQRGGGTEGEQRGGGTRQRARGGAEEELRGGGSGGRPRRSAPVRVAAFVGRTLKGEWHGIVADPVRQLRRRGPAGLLLAAVACGGVIFFHAIAQRPAGATAVRILGGVQGDLPLWLALLRTPISLYVPALDLPVWAGITQLFLAFALAELALGRRRTLAIAYASTLAGTLTVRLMIALGPGWWGLGLPPEVGQVLDTGPSAAVVGLFTYLSVVRHAPIVFTLTGGSMVFESIAKPNLAGREHLIAVGAALVLGLVHEYRRHRRQRPSRPAETRTVDATGADCGGPAEKVVKDAVGNVLRDGDSVVVVQALEVEGSPSGIEAGTKVRGILLADGVDCHDIDCRIDGFGAMRLRSSVVKKA
ncbi:alkylphosphonate utilization protein [Streptomyces sp. NBC_01275]|uniref:alkylphosphonate utilization protein n=1 Tax=Streptomyces sp. NBC_01275 TaxID=2903807 RepID=UPI002B1D7353|nr:alkylphosphonate utilization protein [Streptomyces sp. NBC_01275]